MKPEAVERAETLLGEEALRVALPWALRELSLPPLDR